MSQYKYDSFKQSLKQREWSTVLFGVDLACTSVSWLLSNFTKITPNQVTGLSFLAVIASSYSLSISSLWLAGFFFWLAFLLDCIDGSMARGKKQYSKYGDLLDKTNDTFKPMFIAIGLLLHGLNQNLSSSFILMVLVWVCLNYISSSMWLIFEHKSNKTGNQVLTDSMSSQDSLIAKWYNQAKKLKIKPTLTAGDVNMILFICGLTLISNSTIVLQIANSLILCYIIIELYVIIKQL
jgi:phosphatidylglycerophosphate synthase